MTKKQRKLALKSLSRKEHRILAANMRKWRKKLQPLHDAIDASIRITGDDLKIIVR